MNNTRRKQINKEIATLDTISLLAEGYNDRFNSKVVDNEEICKVIEAFRDAAEWLSDMSMTIDDLAMEERECFENLPEPIQMSDRGEAMELAADNLESARDDIDSLASDVESLADELEEYDRASELDIDFMSIVESIESLKETLEEVME